MLTGEAIREYLLKSKMGNPYGFYKAYSQISRTVTYASVRKYFYILRVLGLIRAIGFVPGEAPFRKHIFAVVEGRETDPAWTHPQIELYPATKFGKKGYLKLRKRGLRPKGGRRAQYTPRGPPPARASPPTKPPPAKKEITPHKPAKVLKPKPKPVIQPPKGKVIVVPKGEVDKRRAEGYKLIREIDGKFMMEKPE
jgi:hypothetical protein